MRVFVTGASGFIGSAIAVRDIAGVIGRCLNVPVVTKSPKEATGYFSWLAPFLSVDNLVSSALTQKLLGWRPERPGPIPDLEEGHYFKQPVGNDSPQRAEKPNLHRASLQPRKGGSS